MKDILKREDLDNAIEVHSYGTSSWHIGSSADPRAISEGRRRGVTLDSKAQQLTTAIAKGLDLILVMDKTNFENVTKLLNIEEYSKIKYLGSFEPKANNEAEIIDTYYSDESGFAKGFEHISRCCEGLLGHLVKNY